MYIRIPVTAVIFSTAISCLLAAGPARSADIYKWVDRQGIVHFTDQPPQQGAQKIIIHIDPHRDAQYQAELNQQAKLLQIYQEDRQDDERHREKTRQARQTRQAKCDLARKNLTGIQTARYLYTLTDDPRNPRILSKAERAAETARVEAAVKHWCE